MRQMRRRLRPVRPSHRNELWYRSELDRIVRLLRARVRAHLLPTLKGLWPEPVATDGVGLVAIDAPGEASARAAVAATAREFGGIQKIAERLAFAAAVRNLDDVDSRLARSIQQSVSVDVKPFLHKNPRIAAATHAHVQINVDLIKSIPDKYFQTIVDAVETNWAGGMRWESLVERIEEIGDITERRAALIARDQTSKMNASFNQVRQTDLGIERFTWQTSEDERVRESHAELDGKVFSWDDLPEVDGEEASPGSPIQCRCVALAFIDLDAMEAELGIEEAA
jgi:SPP1 gp7 family putative phage head morphogenesis protein